MCLLYFSLANLLSGRCCVCVPWSGSARHRCDVDPPSDMTKRRPRRRRRRIRCGHAEHSPSSRCAQNAHTHEPRRMVERTDGPNDVDDDDDDHHNVFALFGSKISIIFMLPMGLICTHTQHRQTFRGMHAHNIAQRYDVIFRKGVCARCVYVDAMYSLRNVHNLPTRIHICTQTQCSFHIVLLLLTVCVCSLTYRSPKVAFVDGHRSGSPQDDLWAARVFARNFRQTHTH